MILAPNAIGQSLESAYRKKGNRVRDAFEPIREKLQEGSAAIRSQSPDDGLFRQYGVVMSPEGYVLVKASEWDEIVEPEMYVDRECFREFTEVSRSSAWDLLLLKVAAEGLSVPDFVEEEPEQGMIVISNSGTSRFRRRGQMGVIAANPRSVGEGSLAVLGVVMLERDGKIVVGAVSPTSGAKDAGIGEGDIIVAVKGKEVANVKELQEVVGERVPGQMLSISLKRIKEIEEVVEVEDPFGFLKENEPEYEELEVEAELRERRIVYPEQRTRNDMMSGEFSPRRTNFPRILQHDTPLTRRTTGGPLILLNGQCVGMNIAFVSRECSYAIPARELKQVYEELLGKGE